MHFPVIEINRQKKSVDERKRSSLDYESPTLNYFCDYYGEEYTPNERYELIRSKWFKELFRGIADVDFRNGGSIKFYSKDKIHETLKEYYYHVLDELDKDKDSVGWHKFYLLRQKGQEYKNCSALFYVDDCAYTSMQFFEDAYYYAGEVLYIGQVFDAHC